MSRLLPLLPKLSQSPRAWRSAGSVVSVVSVVELEMAVSASPQVSPQIARRDQARMSEPFGHRQRFGAQMAALYSMATGADQPSLLWAVAPRVFRSLVPAPPLPLE